MFKFTLKRHNFCISSNVLRITNACKKKKKHCNQDGMKEHHKDPFIIILLLQSCQSHRDTR
jgi:hypothetical protein